ncbi:MAG: radical SAM protein [Bacteroidetes bacterium]|nr:radical SAM protein [Bacteroidota bacterium]
MIKENTAKSILRRQKKIDSWFLTYYGINLYRGCTHNCVYCDGRTEKYQVSGEFGRDVMVKVNALELLDKELDPSRRRKPMPKGFMILCGGVSDAYQPLEAKYKLARQTLELIHKYKYPVHILTKSTLVERDLDLLQKIDRQNKALVCFSFSSVDDEISRIFEPGVPVPSERLATIKKLKNAGISCGMFLMPVIPFITDTPEMIEQDIIKGKEAGVDFVIFGTMTLKSGKQKDYFMNAMQTKFPDLIPQYENIYAKDSQWGESSFEYNKSAQETFNQIATTYKIPKRIPPHIYQNLISKDDLIIVTLEHLDYLLKLKNQKSPYGYAAYSLSKLKDSIGSLSRKELLNIKGVGPVTANIIQEIIQTGKCAYCEKLI